MLQDSDMQTFGVEHCRKSRTVDQLTGDMKTVAQMHCHYWPLQAEPGALDPLLECLGDATLPLTPKQQTVVLCHGRVYGDIAQSLRGSE